MPNKVVNSVIDNELVLALEVPEDVFESNKELRTGYQPDSGVWELIIRYNGSLQEIVNDFEQEGLYIEIVSLNAGFAIVTIGENEIERLAMYKQIEYIEKPKLLYFSINNGRSVSCVPQVQNASVNGLNLLGEGVIVGIVDSGIDYSHPDFRNDDGTTRIISLWDQSIQGNPPEGYFTGSIYTSEQINEALAQVNPIDRFNIVPSTDSESGHGTHVAGICCGNGRASNGEYVGVAPKSQMMVVKVGNSIGESFPRTTRLMEAVNYMISEAARLERPIAINVSIGNNYGAHNGRTTIEEFIDVSAGIWKSTICIGSGNEGSTSRHAGGQIDGVTEVEMTVGGLEPYFNLQLWKNYADDFNIEIISPSGKRIVIEKYVDETVTYLLDGSRIYVYYGTPTPDNILQEVYFVFYAQGSYIRNGIWKFRLVPTGVVSGRYDMWLASGSTIAKDTKFLRPDVNTTLTIPSTSYRSLTVSAYDSLTDRYADFSGRGYTRNDRVKPDIAAPGVNIVSTAPNGGYTTKSGTSMATPFVTGGAALLMEWGIVNGNDDYMYGEKLKAFLISGARRLPEFTEWPNPQVGWGALCVRDSLPI